MKFVRYYANLTWKLGSTIQNPKKYDADLQIATRTIFIGGYVTGMFSNSTNGAKFVKYF